MTTVESGNVVQHGVPMQLKIGVMGAATGDVEAAHRSAACSLGEAIARADCVTITGGCPGLPFAAGARVDTLQAHGGQRHCRAPPAHLPVGDLHGYLA